MKNEPLVANEAALGLIELSTVARGIVVLDQMAKRAKTQIVAARSFSPGRYMVLLSGTVAEIEEAMDAAEDAAKEDRVDALILRDPAEGLLRALASKLDTKLDEALGIFETRTLSGILLAADRALKDAEIQVMELRLGAGLDGRGVFTLTGALHMVEAAKDAVEASVPAEAVLRLEVIANPHPDLPKHLLGAELPYAR